MDNIVDPAAIVSENYYVKHNMTIEIFSYLELDESLKNYGHMSVEAFANWVTENLDTLPKKHRGQKRKLDTDVSHTELSKEESDEVSSDEEEDNAGDLLIDKMLAEMLTTLKSDLHKSPPLEGKSALSDVANQLSEIFPAVRMQFIRMIVSPLAFRGRLVASAIACFFAQNKVARKIQKYAPKLSQDFWCKDATPMANKRKSKSLGQNPYMSTKILASSSHPDVIRYQEIMDKFKEQYPALFNGDELSPKAFSVSLDKSEKEERLKCSVCFEEFAFSKMIFCSVPVARDTTFEYKPSTSANAKVNTSKDSENSFHADEPPTHGFCKTCVRGQASAAVTETPLAEGGVGLKCMEPGCRNPILYSEIRHMIKKEVRKKLDERIFEENIGMAFENLERCPKCNNGIEIDVPKEINKVFDCPNCGRQTCRICQREWDDDHFGITCDELDVKQKRNRKDRLLEKELNEAIIRKCPRCGMPFVKDAGCNKMTCRCGCTQCYICRATDINYSHFCQHIRDPTRKNNRCSEGKMCKSTCLLWENSEQHDEKVIQNIKQKQQSETKGTESGEDPPTSSGNANEATNAEPQQRVNMQLDDGFMIHPPNPFLPPRLLNALYAARTNNNANVRANMCPLCMPNVVYMTVQPDGSQRCDKCQWQDVAQNNPQQQPFGIPPGVNAVAQGINGQQGRNYWDIGGNMMNPLYHMPPPPLMFQNMPPHNIPAQYMPEIPPIPRPPLFNFGRGDEAGPVNQQQQQNHRIDLIAQEIRQVADEMIQIPPLPPRRTHRPRPFLINEARQLPQQNAQNPQLVPGGPSLNQHNGQGANPAQPYNQAQNQQVTQNGQQNPGANNEQQPQNGQPLQPQFFFGLGMMMPPTNNQNNPQGGNGMPWGGIGNTMPNYPLPDNNEVTPDEMRRRMIGFMQAERMRQRHENRALRNQQANPNNNLGMGQPQAQPQQEQPPYVRPGNFNFGNAQHDYDANDLFDDI
ncbi:IBR domain, a half RING-finger domain-containing protein [Ditylenchus destructor]|nr:IBR domain, a half RING-finger domain-containing protein [Ditylenchus destructor]